MFFVSFFSADIEKSMNYREINEFLSTHNMTIFNRKNSIISVLSSAVNLSEPKARATTWHVEPEQSVPYQSHSVDLENQNGSSSPATMRRAMSNPALVQGMQLVSAAAKRVWDELYIYKKPVSSQSQNSFN